MAPRRPRKQADLDDEDDRRSPAFDLRLVRSAFSITEARVLPDRARTFLLLAELNIEQGARRGGTLIDADRR